MKVFEPFKNYDYKYPEEMEKILMYLSEHGKLNVLDKRIESLYYDFSDDVFCASWIGVSRENLERFADYLSEIDV